MMSDDKWRHGAILFISGIICRFWSISCKAPGRVHDATALRLSTLYQKSDELLPKNDKTFHGLHIPLMLLGAASYPRLPWILKGYATPPAGLSRQEELFNAYHSLGHNVIERAFGRLKGLWRITLKRADINYKFMPTVVAAACILHNFCEMNSKNVRECEQGLYQQPSSRPRDTNSVCDVWDFLQDYLAQEFPLRSASW